MYQYTVLVHHNNGSMPWMIHVKSMYSLGRLIEYFSLGLTSSENSIVNINIFNYDPKKSFPDQEYNSIPISVFLNELWCSSYED